MSNFAWVTLATNDSYSLGALVVAYSLKRVSTAHQLAVLITPGVSEAMREKLRAVFNVVQEVDVLDSKDSANLALLARPELGITFTKLHSWKLTQFEKCVFLDADTLVLVNCDELFEREEFSAAPDVGWPDCFNSGVFVFKPSTDTFDKLIQFAIKHGSFDGGDQGLLNQYFSDWATASISKHLPFIYNTTTTAVYSYLPAFKQFGKNVKILHFIGTVKPWLQNFDPQTKNVSVPQGYAHLKEFLQMWWNIFCSDVHPRLSTAMNEIHHDNEDKMEWFKTLNLQFIPSESYFNPSKNNELVFYDPWEDYTKQSNLIEEVQLKYDQPEEHISYPQFTQHETFTNEIPVITETINETIKTYETQNKIETSTYSETYSVVHTDSVIHVLKQDHISKEQISRPIPKIFQKIPKIKVPKQVKETIQYPVAPKNVQETIHFPEEKIPSPEVPKHVQEPLPEIPKIQKSIPSNNLLIEEKLSSPNIEVMATNTEKSGIAGALAKLTLGEARSSEQEEFENHMRRQCWESGNIDYMGKDSFENIWRRIQTTMESAPKSSSPPPQRDSTPQPQSAKKEVNTTIAKQDEGAAGGQLVSPHELLRNMSHPGDVGQEQIITTVMPDGRIIERKVVTYPEKEIEITDTETIEYVGAKATKTTRNVSSKELPPSTKPAAIQPKQATQVVQKNDQSTGEQPAKRPITQIVPKEGDIVEFDESTNTTIVTRKTEKGHEKIYTTVNPDGTKKQQIKTFYDMVVIPGEEEEEEEYEEYETFENSPSTKTTTTTTTSGTKTTSTESTTDCKTMTVNQNKTTASDKSQVQITEQQTEKKEKTEQQTEKKQKVEPTPGKKPITQVVPQKGDIVEFDKSTNTTIVTRKIVNGHEKIYTTVNADGTMKQQVKTFYDSVVVPGDEETEEYEEEETVTNTPSKKITTTTSTSSAKAISTQSTTDSKTMTVNQNKSTTSDSQIQITEQQLNQQIVLASQPQKKTSVVKRDTQHGSEEIIKTITTDGKTTTTNKKKTVSKPEEEIEIEEYEETTEPQARPLKVVTKQIPMLSTVDTRLKNTQTSQATEQQTRRTSVTSTTTSQRTQNQSTTIIAEQQIHGQPKTSVVSKKTTTGSEQITTTVNADGTTKKQTQKYHNPKTTHGDNEIEEEEIEEYEEEIIEPGETVVKTTTTTTPGSRTLVNKKNQQTGDQECVETMKTRKITTIESTHYEVVPETEITEVTTTSQGKKDIKNMSSTNTSQDKSTATSTKKTQGTSTNTSTSQQDSTQTKGTKTTTAVQQQSPQGEPKIIRETKKVPGGTEHTITTINPDGTRSFSSKTFYDAVPVPVGEDK